MPLENPFTITRTENFNHSYDHLAALMHFKRGAADRLLSSDNVFLEGSRGSGKSMYLRLLALPVKAKYEEMAALGNVDALPSHKPFVGVYAKLTAVVFSPHEHEGTLTYGDKFQQLFNIYCVEHMISTVDECRQLGVVRPTADQEKQVTSRICRTFLNDESSPTFSDLAARLRAERRKTRQALDELEVRADHRAQPDVLWDAAEAITSLPDFQDWRLHLLLDEFDSLSSREQQLINTYLRKRDYPISFKIGCRKHRLNLIDKYERPLNTPGDYDREELDDDDFGRSSTFKKYLEFIADKRLAHAGYTEGIRSILGPRPRKPRSKAERQYGGFDDLALLSSGVVRNFIELCRDAFSFATRDSSTAQLNIALVDQDRVVKDHAASRWNSVARDSSSQPELQTLIRKIAALFAERSSGTNEKKIIRLEVVDYDRASAFLRRLLNSALEYEALVQPNRERLQKNKNETSRGFLLNRLLCVSFKLEPESRWDYEITSERLERVVLTGEGVGVPSKKTAVRKQPVRGNQLELGGVLHSDWCPILDLRCSTATEVESQGFLSCRLPEGGKMRDAERLLKQEFGKYEKEGVAYRIRTAEDFDSVGDIACKVCGAYSACAFVLVELSRFSPSVTMELGLALGRGLPTYLLFNKQEQPSIPEPFSSLEYSHYSITPNGVKSLVERLAPQIRNANSTKPNIRLGPLEPPAEKDCKGVFVCLPSTEYHQEMLLPVLKRVVEDMGVGPLRTETEGQALHELQRAVVGIANSRFVIVENTFATTTPALYLGVAQGYRKPFCILQDLDSDGRRDMFTNARSKSVQGYRDSTELEKTVREFFLRFRGKQA